MNENLKTCPNCNTVNEEGAAFCRQCGAKLEQETAPVQTAPVTELNGESVVNSEQTSGNTVDNNYQTPQTETDFSQTGINEQEFAAYIGKNQERFLPSFRKFFTGKKASFSPLVFLLIWLVSPIVGAFWFFHRKIYKVGSIILSIGIVFTIISSSVAVCMVNDIMDFAGEYIGGITEYYSGQSKSESTDSKLRPVETYSMDDIFGDYDNQYDYDDYYEDYFGDYSDDYNYGYNDNDVEEFTQQFVKQYLNEIVKVISKYMLWISILNILQLAMAIVFGIFAKYFYFQDAVKKISAIKQKNPTPSSINEIAMAGGTSCAAWVIILVAYIVISMVFAIALVGNIFTTVLNFVR